MNEQLLIAMGINTTPSPFLVFVMLICNYEMSLNVFSTSQEIFFEYFDILFYLCELET